MKRSFLFLVAVLACVSQVFAQDTISVYHVNKARKVSYETEYSLNEIDSLIMSSRTAFIDDAELLLYQFKQENIDNSFWYDAVNRYVQWPEKAEEADRLGNYYHPKSVIYVPNSDYVNAIVFDWRDDNIKIGIFCEDGLWTTTESLDTKWEIYIDSTFAKQLDFDDYEENW